MLCAVVPARPPAARRADLKNSTETGGKKLLKKKQPAGIPESGNPGIRESGNPESRQQKNDEVSRKRNKLLECRPQNYLINVFTITH